MNVHDALETAALGAVPGALVVGMLRQRLGGRAGGGVSAATSRSPLAGWMAGSAASRSRPRQRSGRWAGRPSPGVDDGSRWATRRDLAALACPGGGGGRLVLGTTWGSWPRRLLAAETAQSVAVVGPTQSGKTTALAIPAILGWDGPVLAASVKTDLVRDTLSWRRRCGTVWCFDPAGTTGLPPSRWSPLAGAASWQGARRVAADLTEVTRSDSTTADGEFWYATAAKLLAPLLFAAAASGRAMDDVVRWVDTQEMDEVLDILHAAGVPEAIQAARATWLRDERQRSAVYTTAETVLEPFAESASGATHPLAASVPTYSRAAGDRTPPYGVASVQAAPSIGAAGSPIVGAGEPVGSDIDPQRLLTGRNTLYLCAPAHDQRRLRGLFVALVQQVLHAVFARAARAGKPLHPPLLVVLDEAANIAPLRDLDGLAATCAGHGVQLMTVWQDLAQVRARYGERGATVVNNHRAKVFLPGIADPGTLDFASQLAGEREHPTPSVTYGARGERTVTAAPVLRRLLPPDALRRMAPGTGVLLYGALPPARIRLRAWFGDPLLADRAGRNPVGRSRPGPGRRRPLQSGP